MIVTVAALDNSPAKSRILYVKLSDVASEPLWVYRIDPLPSTTAVPCVGGLMITTEPRFNPPSGSLSLAATSISTCPPGVAIVALSGCAIGG